jgi:hypothetical protein
MTKVVTRSFLPFFIELLNFVYEIDFLMTGSWFKTFK